MPETDNKIENKVTVVCCTPTYALRLAQVAAEEKIDLRQSQVKTLIVAGEPGGSVASVRARISRKLRRQSRSEAASASPTLTQLIPAAIPRPKAS